MEYNGSNSLKIKKAIKERKKYKELIFKPFTPTPIDFYYESPLYGKIDRDMNGVVFLVDQENLRATLSPLEDPSILVPRFIAKAYEDFKVAFDKITSETRGIAPEGLGTVIVKRAYINFDSLYKDYLSALRESLIDVLLREHEKNIYNFSDFMKYIEIFASSAGMKFPLTRTSYLLSKAVPRNVTGLVLELGIKRKESDSPKAAMIQSKSRVDKNVVDSVSGQPVSYVHQAFEADFVNNYDWFMNLAANYGFSVNKNAPWVLVADITSLKMQGYLGRFGMAVERNTASEFFELFYTKSYTEDMKYFADFMYSVYREYVVRFPAVIKPKYYHKCKFTTPAEYMREPLPLRGTKPYDPAYHKYSMSFWLPILFRIRMFEQDPFFAQREKALTRSFERDILELYNKKGLNTAMKLLNTIVKKHSYLLQNHMPNDFSAMKKTSLSDYYAITKGLDNERRKDFSIY